MTELQMLIRDSNGMPPLIRADYLQDHGFDLEADWLRQSGLNTPGCAKDITTGKAAGARSHIRANGIAYGAGISQARMVYGTGTGASCGTRWFADCSGNGASGSSHGANCSGNAYGAYALDFPDYEDEV
jgi:hypothetical protein